MNEGRTKTNIRGDGRGKKQRITYGKTVSGIFYLKKEKNVGLPAIYMYFVHCAIP